MDVEGEILIWMLIKLGDQKANYLVVTLAARDDMGLVTY